VNCPPPIVDELLRSINGIYNFNKVINDNLQQLERDPDVDYMKLYKEKIESLQENNVPINTAQIKKALLKVLRFTADVETDGANTSSAGSDNAPSEDNLKPEEIAEVVP
jgi:aminopeptidase-like protein